jgi:hypothetical protein
LPLGSLHHSCGLGEIMRRHAGRIMFGGVCRNYFVYLEGQEIAIRWCSSSAHGATDLARVYVCHTAISRCALGSRRPAMSINRRLRAILNVYRKQNLLITGPTGVNRPMRVTISTPPSRRKSRNGPEFLSAVGRGAGSLLGPDRAAGADLRIRGRKQSTARHRTHRG